MKVWGGGGGGEEGGNDAFFFELVLHLFNVGEGGL